MSHWFHQHEEIIENFFQNFSPTPENRSDYLCTDEYGDLLTDCGHNDTCYEPDPIYENEHEFLNDTNGVVTIINASQVKLEFRKFEKLLKFFFSISYI